MTAAVGVGLAGGVALGNDDEATVGCVGGGGEAAGRAVGFTSDEQAASISRLAKTIVTVLKRILFPLIGKCCLGVGLGSHNLLRDGLQYAFSVIRKLSSESAKALER